MKKIWISTLKNRNCWKDSAMNNKKNRLFSEKQENFIRINVRGRSNQELTNLVNEKYGLEVTVMQVKTWKKNHNISSGLTGFFEKGHVPINKGTTGMFNVGGNKTSFKKGDIPHNYNLVRSMVYTPDDGRDDLGVERLNTKESTGLYASKDLISVEQLSALNDAKMENERNEDTG